MIVFGLAISAPVTMMLLHLLLQRTVFAGGDPKARLGLVIRIVMGVTATWGLLSIGVLSRLSLSVPLLLLNTAFVLVVSFGLGMCYFNVFTLSETALRIRLLMESFVAERRGGSDGAVGIVQRYDAPGLIRVRIDRLLAMKAAVEQDGKILAVSRPLIWTSKLFHFISALWKWMLFGSATDSRTSKVWKNL